MKDKNKRNLLVKIITLPIAAYGLYSIIKDQSKKVRASALSFSSAEFTTPIMRDRYIR